MGDEAVQLPLRPGVVDTLENGTERAAFADQFVLMTGHHGVVLGLLLAAEGGHGQFGAEHAHLNGAAFIRGQAGRGQADVGEIIARGAGGVRRLGGKRDNSQRGRTGRRHQVSFPRFNCGYCQVPGNPFVRPQISLIAPIMPSRKLPCN